MSVVFATIVPVFSIVALGYWIASRREMHLPTLSDLTILIASPCLMFSVLSGADVDLGRWSTLFGAAVFTMLATGGIALLYSRTAGGHRHGIVLAAVFWNSGNMGLACARLAFGPEGLASAAILYVTVAIFTSSIGIWIAKGENGFGEVLKMPLFYASVGGLALGVAEVAHPRMLMEPIEMVGATAIPLMLLNLGFQLRRLEVDDVRHALAAVGIRVVGGFACMLLFVELFDVRGVDAQVMMLHSVMPAAVINVVFAQRYDRDPALVASAIVIGTLLSLVTIPAVLLWVS